MKKPSVVKAFDSEILSPHLAPLGFVRYGNKKYGRVRGDVCQYLFLQVESRMSREFMLEYGAILICQPHESPCLDPGGRFPDGKNGTWYRANSEDSLRRSIDLIAAALPSALIDWLEGSIAIDGFIATYLQWLDKNQHLRKKGHSEFTLACAYALTGEKTVAAEHATQAVRDFEDIYSERPTCDWALDGAQRCKKLLAALRESSTNTLFSDWRTLTVESLKLQPLLGKARP